MITMYGEILSASVVSHKWQEELSKLSMILLTITTDT